MKIPQIFEGIFHLRSFIEISFSWKNNENYIENSRMCYNSSTKGNFCEKAIAECLGTFILVFWDRAVLGNGMEGIGTTGIALAFG